MFSQSFRLAFRFLASDSDPLGKFPEVEREGRGLGGSRCGGDRRYGSLRRSVRSSECERERTVKIGRENNRVTRNREQQIPLSQASLRGDSEGSWAAFGRRLTMRLRVCPMYVKGWLFRKTPPLSLSEARRRRRQQR